MQNIRYLVSKIKTNQGHYDRVSLPRKQFMVNSFFTSHICI